MKHVGVTLLFAALAASCLDPASDDLGLAKGDEKLGAAVYLPAGKIKVLGSLDYGDLSALVKYSRAPKKFKAYKFAGNEGDAVTVDVRSPNGGDAIAWVLDNDFKVIGFNDDTADSLDAKISLVLPAHASATHYVVYRDYAYRTKKFQVSLSGYAAEVAACAHDSDCEKIAGGCCGFDWTALGVGQSDIYNAGLACDAAQVCSKRPLVLIDDAALCNLETNQCELVAVEDIACGGHSINAHACPEGFECQGPGLAYDAFGTCVRLCDGEAGQTCPTGFACADNPNDDCSPFHEGSQDCPTMCEPDCSTLVCDEGSYCTGCWGHFACIPDGAAC